LPGISIKDLDPFIAARRAELGRGGQEAARVSGPPSRCSPLIDWQHRYPYGLGETVGNGLTSKIVFRNPGEVEATAADDRLFD